MDEGRIGGSYPGGPRRRSGDEAPAPTPRIETQEERADRRGRSRRERGERRRRRRRLGVLLASAVLAGVAGFLLGAGADKGSEEITTAREQSRQGDALEGVLRGEANRVIQQMWLSEILEKQPLPPR